MEGCHDLVMGDDGWEMAFCEGFYRFTVLEEGPQEVRFLCSVMN